jgi:hypothetical protein
MNYQIEAADMAMDGTANEGTSNIRQEYNLGRVGLDMDSSVNQVQKGKLSYALNAALENFDANSVSYQNEPSNELCLNFPAGFHLIGTHFIQEKSKHIFFLTNPETGASQIGYMDNNDCVYHVLCSETSTGETVCANSPCLNFDINYPIHKAVHKITNCSTEVYWTDGLNPRRFIDIEQVPYITTYTGEQNCDPIVEAVLDCNKLKVQPNFSIPSLEVTGTAVGGDLRAGSYQFAIQYSNASGDGYTSYYSVTNPTPIANTDITTPNFDYSVGQSILLSIANVDITGYFQYFNLAVIKTINNGTTVELVGTYKIEDKTTTVTYTGQNVTQIPLSLNDVLEKFPYYDIAQDVTNVQDIIVWDNLTSIDRINYQGIANKINLQWETYKLPAGNDYSDSFYATNLRGYLRDEVYAFEIVFLLSNGKQTDGFHIPGRAKNYQELSQPNVTTANPDYIGDGTPQPYWKIYNTASVLNTYPAGPGVIGDAYPYQSGDFAYWESEEEYPCNVDVWGDLAGQKIRHHKFPDVLVSPYFETPTITYSGGQIIPEMQTANAIYPIGVKIDVQQVAFLIGTSDLTDEEKAAIVGFKIVRGNRSTNKSIIGKGILRNVGKYNRQGTDYFYPNYPYNDLNKDPFLLEKNNAYMSECDTYTVNATVDGTLQFTDCYTGEPSTFNFTTATTEICSITLPVVNSGTATFQNVTSGTYIITAHQACNGLFSSKPAPTFNYTDPVTGALQSITVPKGTNVTVNSIGSPTFVSGCPNYNIVASSNVNMNCFPNNLNGFSSDESKYRQVFNSPETSFGQPTLGNVLKLESVLFGAGRAHFVEVERHSKYKLLTKQAQIDALNSSKRIADLGGFSATAFFTAYQTYLQIYITGISRKNFAQSFNSISSYDYSVDVPNDQGVKQRQLDKCQYVFPGVQNVGDIHDLNNWNRESSVYTKTIEKRPGVAGIINPLPYPNQSPSLYVAGVSKISDDSRFTISQKDSCATPEFQHDIKVVSYYASIKAINNSQWGQIYTYQTIDTGFQRIFNALPANDSEVIFGGDTYIGKFGFKTKLPFFIDNRVNAPDDSDIYYDELGNVAYPQYWYSARSILSDYYVGNTLMKNIISTKAHYFDCPNDSIVDDTSTTTTTSSTTPPPGTTIGGLQNYIYDGKMYSFAYGVPYYYVESSINVDLRQAFNNLEGDFYPHVSSGIPDQWFQESRVPIAFDNTYYYNTTYSKQNVENFFSHLPSDWVRELCYTQFPFRAIYSDPQQSYTDNRINSWLIYRPVSFFDFPQNYGKLTSLDGIQNRATLARFENKTLLYGNLLTINTSNPQAAYLGNPSLFGATPPIDYAETDLGYVGSQNKFLLKIPNGQITVDAKRGQIFLIQGTQAIDISGFGSGLNRFFTDHLSFEILRYFPTVNTDNHFNGLGLHGVFDSKFERIIITKLDYIPQAGKQIYYDDVEQRFYINKPVAGNTFVKTFVELTDVEYFCNKSWTASFNLNTKAWVSFHTYLPNFYIGENNFFYSGLNEGCDMTAVAVVEVASPTTTTTTTPVPLQCNLAGTAVYIPPPTTTTTTSSSTSTTTSTTSTTTTPVPTTTTTTTPGPGIPEWYYIYDCSDGTIVTSTNYVQGTFSLNETVYSPITGRYYYISNISATNPGAPNYYIQYYGGTLCPATTTTTTTLPPITLTLTVLCDNVGTYQGKVVATWSGGSGNGYQIRAGYGFSYSSYRSMGTTQTLTMTSDTNPYDGTSGLRNTTGGSDVFAVQVIDNNGTGAFNSTTQITSINCGTTTTTTTPAPTTTTTTTPTPGSINIALVYGSMEPCFGGSIDDHMGAHVVLSSTVSVDTNFLVQVSYVGIGNTCGVGESTQSFPVIVPAGSSSDNFQACVDGAYFPAGAVVCSACILSCDNPAVNLTGATC